MDVTVAPVSARDSDAFVAAVLASRDLHHPWIDPADSEERFESWLQHLRRDDQEAYLIRHAACGGLAGYVSVSNIVRRAFQSAHLGYGAFSSHAGRGLMTQGLGAVIDIAFRKLGLHRLEANIQPTNAASLGLVRKLGFEREGYSPRYLMVDSDWRDHERWAIRAEAWKPTPTIPVAPIADYLGEDLVLREIENGQKPVLEHLWQMYKHDMSEFVHSLPDQHGCFKTKRLHEYLSDEHAQVLMLWRGESPVGFVTVGTTVSGRRSIGDFFVVRRIRRRGVGLSLALEVIARYPGPWEVGFQVSNTAAATLWRKVAATVSGGAWEEQRRPVPGKPDVPADAFVIFTTDTGRAT